MYVNYEITLSPVKNIHEIIIFRLIDYFRLFIVATGCPSERRPQKTVNCYGV